jgi:uncharacterized repeat protein (TIGR03803 family)
LGPSYLLLTAILISFWSAAPAVAQEQVLFRFDGTDGASPFAPLIFDQAGNLYGTTQYGGPVGNGVVFQLVSAGGGNWTQNILHAFQGAGDDGAVPYGALALDTAGNLYGTTSQGGSTAGPDCVDYGCGTVFQLTHTGATWTETVLYQFQGGADGYYPLGGLVIDRAGNLYGTTNLGGSCNGGGTAFQLTHRSNGWTKSIIHNFCATTGNNPAYGTLIFDHAGNLYGAAYNGSFNGTGVVFRLNRLGANAWVYTVLHQFTDVEGFVGPTNLTIDSQDNVYGTGASGGLYGWGTVWQLMPTGATGYHLNVLYNFQGGSDGETPESAPVFSTDGKLYGTTYSDGEDYLGIVYQLTPHSNGQWTESVFYRFQPSGADPYNAVAPFIVDALGNLYGTSPKGCYQIEGNCSGAGCGCVYEIIP